jgi:hypothetical protein
MEAVVIDIAQLNQAIQEIMFPAMPVICGLVLVLVAYLVLVNWRSSQVLEVNPKYLVLIRPCEDCCPSFEQQGSPSPC